MSEKNDSLVMGMMCLIDETEHMKVSPPPNKRKIGFDV
jgi:hypothetical protein